MKVYVTGDTHGRAADFQALTEFASAHELTAEDVIIVAGDVGVYYGGLTFGAGRKIMGKAPCRFLLLRGNHDDRIESVMARPGSKACWCEGRLLGNTAYADQRYPNVFYALDQGGLYEIYGEKVLFVPGAYSIDKFYRLQNDYPYNPDEQLTAKEMDDLLHLADGNPDISGVIAHTAPLSWEPCFRDLFFYGLDQSKVDKTTDRFLDVLVERLPNLQHYYFGHFHADRNCGEHGTMLFHAVIEYGTRLPE